MADLHKDTLRTCHNNFGPVFSPSSFRPNPYHIMLWYEPLVGVYQCTFKCMVHTSYDQRLVDLRRLLPSLAERKASASWCRRMERLER